MRSLSYAFALVLVTVFVCAATTPSLGYTQRDEEELGRKYAKEIDQQSKAVEDEAVKERVRRIGAVIAKIANEHEVPAHYGSPQIFKFSYTFKVIDDKDVNAYSLPGGIIYINSGLIDLIESDDELAGVLAHEIAHTAHHHLVQIIQKQSRVDKYIALITLAGILGNMRNEDFNNLILGAQLVKIGKVSSYTQEAEKDADRCAVTYLAKSPYNPEGMLSFMKKLEKVHEANPTLPLGIYQTHPAPFRRVASISKAMQNEGIQVDTRRLRDVAYARSEPIEEGSDLYRVTISKRVLYEPAPLRGRATSKQRAEAIAAKVNSLLDSGLTPRAVCADASGMCLLANGGEVVRVEAEDAALAGDDSRALVDKALSVLKYAIWADWLCSKCQVIEEADATSLD